MYGQHEYGTMEYASAENDGVKEEYYTDLLPLVPGFISEKKEMKELYKTQGYEIGRLEHALQDIILQCFISSATWGLKRWEQVFGVETNLGLTFEQRREILFAKMRGQGTATKEMFSSAAAAFSGGEVEVSEDYENSTFIVRFIGIKGIPRNMQGFIQMLEEIKPAHLAYRFEYRYTIWNHLQTYYWDDASSMSWDELRILKEE